MARAVRYDCDALLPVRRVGRSRWQSAARRPVWPHAEQGPGPVVAVDGVDLPLVLGGAPCPLCPYALVPLCCLKSGVSVVYERT